MRFSPHKCSTILPTLVGEIRFSPYHPTKTPTPSVPFGEQQKQKLTVSSVIVGSTREGLFFFSNSPRSGFCNSFKQGATNGRRRPAAKNSLFALSESESVSSISKATRAGHSGVAPALQNECVSDYCRARAVRRFVFVTPDPTTN